MNSWRGFGATARQIAALECVASNKYGRTTHIFETDMWSDDITYYIIVYGLKIMKQMSFILSETEPSSGRL